MWVHWKVGHKNTIYRENGLKREAWTVWRFKGGSLTKKRAMHFI